MKPRKLGEILIELGLIDEAGLAKALEVQNREGGTLGRVVSGLGLADEKTVTNAIADWFKFECVDAPAVRPETAPLLPVDFCLKRLVVPLGESGGRLRLAMADPLDLPTIQDVEFRTGRRVLPVVAPESAIRSALDGFSGSENVLDDISLRARMAELDTTTIEPVIEDDEEIDPEQLANDCALPDTVRRVTMILADAVKDGASDIHLEPQERGLHVRYRIDGLLHDVLQMPKSAQDAVISRIKIMAGLDITERRKPQDGRSQLKTEGRRVDLRVSTLPTQYGEKIVIRILDSSKAQIDMTQLGLLPQTLEKLQRLLTAPQGMILVTGPTGSGKTSTLYASLNWVKSSTKNIVTIEDPIEFRLPGISQVQIHPKAGLTFASGLRSFLRQDPNVILVGEIRDQETAGIALEAAQTGHLLLSTLHTNDAIATITRLLDLGLEPFLIASSISGILAQRLVRRVCPACATAQAVEADVLEQIGGPCRVPADAVWKAGVGCAACKQSGYKGRLAIHELLEITGEIRTLIANRAADPEIREAARRAGMHSLMEDGLAKAAQGLTTLDEVLRVVPRDDLRGATRPSVEARPAPAPVPTGAPVSAGTPSAVDGPVRVLVVEDSPTIAQVVRYFLELQGYEVLIASDGVEGLTLARAERPDVIVSDVEMPRMTGTDMVRALREDPATRDTPIMLLTALTSVECEAAGLDVGADDYVPKPVEPRRLGARVKTLLARTRGRRTDGAPSTAIASGAPS